MSDLAPYEPKYPVQPIHRQAIVQRMAMIVANKDTPDKSAIAASRVLIAADTYNQNEEINSKPQEHIHNHTGSVQLEAKQQREIILQNPDYLEYLYKKQMEKQTDATALDAVIVDRGDDERGRDSDSENLPSVNGSGH